MKIALCINDLRRAGAERLVTDLAIELNKKNNIEVDVVVSNLNCDYLINELTSVNVYSLDTDISLVQIPIAIKRMKKYLKKSKPDIIHSHLPFSHLISRVASIGSTTTHISTYHNVQSQRNNIKRTTEYITRPISKRIICVSEGVKKSYSRSDKFTPIYNSIDVSKFREAIKEFDTNKHINVDAETVLLNVGRCVKQKRQIDLVDMMDYMSDRDIHLFIVGDGELRPKVEHAVESRGLNDQITVTGFVESIEPYYDIADIFVSSSSREGLPTTHIEAMAAELPVVSTKIPGVTEIVKEGENGFLCDVGDTECLADNAKKAIAEKDMGHIGRLFVEREFTLEKMTEQHISLYKKICL